MSESNLEARVRFLEETGIRLKAAGFQIGVAEDGLMPVSWQVAPLMLQYGCSWQQPGTRYVSSLSSLSPEMQFANTHKK